MQSQEISPTKRLAQTKPREEGYSDATFERETTSKNQTMNNTSKADTFERDTNE